MIDFLNPVFFHFGQLSVSWLAVGVLAAAIPLIIHLSRSRRTKKMRFSTTRFFTDQFLRSYHMSRLKELLLLACRMLLCGLLAMALAQPIIKPKVNAFEGSRAVVLVLDNSASMGYTEGGVALLERARGVARKLIEELGPDDTVSVVLAARRESGPELLYEKKPTAEAGDVLQAVNAVKVETLGTDLTGAMARAETIANSSAAQSKEVYIFSDLQDSGWELPDKEAAGPSNSDVLFFFVSIRPKEVRNLAVTAVEYGASRPMTGVPFTIRPHISSQGDLGRACDVKLYVDGKKVSERRLEKLQDGRWAVPRFYHTFTTSGWHSGHVEVEDDTLTLDNRRYFAFEVLESVKVLAVNGAPSQVPRLDELFFLKTALTAPPEDKKASPIAIDVIGPPALGGAELDKYPLVILANVESLSADAVEKLEAFVDRGGSLLVFLGDKVNTSFYNQNLAASTRLHGGLLPGRLEKILGNPAGTANFATIGDVDHDHVVLAAFQDPKFASLAGVTFKALWHVVPEQAAVLMQARETDPKATAGLPLLCEKAFGKGRVLLFASTCDRDWTNFPVRPAFLPWTHRLVGYLAQEPLGRQTFYATGQAIPVPVSAAEGLPQVLVKKPDGTLGHAVAGNDPEQRLVFADTTQPGIYALNPDKPDKGPLFAVNLDSFESKLTYLDEVLAEADEETASANREDKITAGLKKRLDRPLISYVADADRVTEASQAARRGFKLWDIVLAIVLAIALFEPWFANRISIRHYARPKDMKESSPARAGRWGRIPERPGTEPQVQEVGS